MHVKLRPAKRLIVDLSSLCWTSLHAGTDTEFGQEVLQVYPDGRERTVRVNSAEHGIENAIDFLQLAWRETRTVPKDTILVMESGNTKALRQRLLPGYKEKRDQSPDEMYEQFNLLKQKVIDVVKSVGGRSVTRQNMEGDDIIAYLVSNLKGEKVIMSQDGDLAALMTNPDVTLFRKGEVVYENPYGPFDPQLIPVYKALVGDPSDSIPGAKGFGPAAWEKLLAIFGEEGAAMVGDLIQQKRLPELQANVEDLKPLANVIANATTVEASYAAGLLYPQLVEHLRFPMKWDVGYVKQRRDIEDERLQPYGGITQIVHKGNFLQALDILRKQVKRSEYISLDLETTVPDESLDWLELNEKPKAVDVVGSKVVSMGLTFGANQHLSLYFVMNHNQQDGLENISEDQFREVLALIATDIPKIIHNVGFELPVLYLNFGKLTDQIFINPCFDTAIAANYVDENIGRGLKFLTKHYLDYDQMDYDTVTTKYREEVDPDTGEVQQVPYQVKMDALSATEVLGYGSDDTIMTSALFQHFRTVMELEGSSQAYFDVEEKAAYVTALAFAHGTPISIERLREMEQEDDELERQSREVLNALLIRLGWEGTQVPVYTAEDLVTPAKIKEIYLNITGEEFTSRRRVPSKLYTEIGLLDHDLAPVLQTYFEDGNVEAINTLVADRFDGEPKLDVSSPKQVKDLLYRKLKLPVHLINNATATEREKQPELAQACYKFNRIARGSSTAKMTDEELELIIDKAKADDTAISFALAFDVEPGTETYNALKAFSNLKEIATRRSLFYKNYRYVTHWDTGRVHSSIRQCSTVTRRHTSSFPNTQQLPKPNKGKLRDLFISQYENGLIISADLSGAELRLGADLSRDQNMLDCFIGEHKKDMHSMTASDTLRLRWGDEVVDTAMEYFGVDNEYDLFIQLRKRHAEVEVPESIKDLRDKGKTTNFSSAYGGTAAKLAEILVIPLHEAEILLQAKFDMFPRYEAWKLEEEEDLGRTGFATTYRGARRHLQHAITSENRWDVSRAQRQGPNFKIQGACGEMLRLAMADLWDSGILWNLRCNFIAPVHDELVMDSHPEDALEVARVLHRCMIQKDYMDIVPVVSSLSIGTSFYDQPEIEFDDEEVFQDDLVKLAIEKALERHALAA